ncbi:MAG: hypothetical protein QGG67_21425 [Gammaproteobacteria bacterium]|jgi:hypothetical protein|nr:hypothetical protein [Gammaproteobacteria bacterium]MDP7455784.1 hypothetical protein [Gammaproteobacteria bacterium]|tara:strand:- start:35 stop:394 length:360 start_codon:yes stop_codon:yes gene_type:complete
MMRKALLLVMAVVLTGCLVTVDSDSRQLQTVWNEADATRLQLGISNEEWVITTFGDPISRLAYADGTEIWKYRNRSEKDMEVGVFLIFSVDIEEERTETLSIQFTEGLVTNYWIEEDRF